MTTKINAAKRRIIKSSVEALFDNPVTKIDQAVAYLKKRFKNKKRQHKLMIILGSGLGESLGLMQDEIRIRYQDIPFFPVPTVEGHAGILTSARFGKTYVLIMSGRPHRYEGFTGEKIAFPIRVAYMLGVKTLGITNACGGLNPCFREADLMLIKDHVNLMGTNPLIGPNLDCFGVRFPDMHEPYNLELRRAIQKVAQGKHIKLQEGVFTAIPGPPYETPAEMRAMRTLGIDATGMSTIQEVITAMHCTAQGPMKAFGISIITDLCDPDHPRVLTHKEVQEVARKAAPKLGRLLRAIITQIKFE